MVALVPPVAVAEELAALGTEPVNEIHVTMLYLGKLGEDVTPETVTTLCDVVKGWAGSRQCIEGVYNGRGLFCPNPNDDEKSASICLLDAPGITEAFVSLCAALDIARIPFHRDHSYTPHSTVAYLDPAEASVSPLAAPIPVSFSEVTVCAGPDRTYCPFAADRDVGTLAAHGSEAIIPYAREAWVLGYAIYGPAVDARSRELCIAAIETAVEHYDMPGVIEAVSAQATKDGLRAKLYMRRDRLMTRTDKSVRGLCLKLAHGIDKAEVVGMILTELRPLGLAEADSPPSQRKQVATAALLAWLLRAVRTNPELSAQWAELTAGTALYAQAEGTTAAVALQALMAGKGPVDLETLYDSVLANLRDLDLYWQGTDQWVRSGIQGLAGDLGRQIAALIEQGATREELEAAVGSVLGTGDGAAFYLNQALATAYNQAALQSDAMNGYQVNWVTSGGPNVCSTCEALEDGSPYDAAGCPTPPEHGNCACALEPAD
jgi:2'-5' RNA ligase